jgi:hypothetical protein
LTSDSGVDSLNLGKESGLLGGDPSVSLILGSSLEGINLGLSWGNSAVALWLQALNSGGKAFSSSFSPGFNLLFPFGNLFGEGFLVFSDLDSDGIDVGLVIEFAVLFLVSAGSEAVVSTTVPVSLELSDTDKLV